jgi:hypothetical protein
MSFRGLRLALAADYVARQLHSRAVAPVVALQVQGQATQGRDLSALAPLRALWSRTPDRAWLHRAVGEGVTSCPRAGCRKSARPVRRAGCGNRATVEPVRHRQTKGAATDMLGLPPLRHISTLPKVHPPQGERNRCPRVPLPRGGAYALGGCGRSSCGGSGRSIARISRRCRRCRRVKKRHLPSMMQFSSLSKAATCSSVSSGVMLDRWER